MKLGLCFFFIAFLGVVFGNGTFSSAAASQCNVSIAHCYNQEEFLMESEISRRGGAPFLKQYYLINLDAKTLIARLKKICLPEQNRSAGALPVFMHSI
ncbi:hypothetical protein CKAN_00110700 [Cinnamomum micranthum f. kanehirae]|uniref:Uncharacterized protein n=1 Tax=Cinnamomum micranthum f. kanehirae TaxID=337451 RepID=A0A443N2Y5_9MAGN|nr:hypothetical protein CKAN_00110700 [Cinnamomum micranthum f. kanehirae]